MNTCQINIKSCSYIYCLIGIILSNDLSISTCILTFLLETYCFKIQYKQTKCLYMNCIFALAIGDHDLNKKRIEKLASL